MHKIVIPLFMLAMPFYSISQNNSSEGAKLLFTNVKTNLSPAEKNTIYKNLQFRLSKDKKEFVSAEDTGSEFPFAVQVYPTDLNKDGKEEIFVVFGNSYTSGHTGSSVVLYIKNTAGNYAMNLGFPGMAPDLMPTTSKGYPDLLIGGPGFEFPVWRWNGKEYAFYKKIKEQELQKITTRNVANASEAYQSTLQAK